MDLQDPFNIVKEQVEQSLTEINSLFERWNVILNNSNTAKDKEFKWTSDKIDELIKSVEWDLSDLEETIAIVEANRQKFHNISDQELEKRKNFVKTTQQSVNQVKSTIHNSSSKGKIESDKKQALLGNGVSKKSDRWNKLEEANQKDNEQFVRNQQQVQQEMMEDQDQDLGELSNIVGNLGQIGNAMHKELDVQSKMLEDYETAVDDTSHRIKRATHQVNKILKSTKDKGSWCAIICLTIILVALIVTIISL